MAPFWHVDLEGKLSAGQRLEMRPHPAHDGGEGQKWLEEVLPGGVSPWGAAWTYAFEPIDFAADDREPMWQRQHDSSVELVWELVRQRWFPKCPSRLQAVFAYESLDQAHDFMDERQQPKGAQIWRLEAEHAFAADSAWLTLSGAVPQVLAKAQAYWQGRVRPASLPVQHEHLLWGEVTVAERVAR